MPLHEQLEIERGLVAAVGAGGKKSVLHALAEGWPAASGRLLMTATARCTPPPDGLFEQVLSGDTAELCAQLARPEPARVFAAGPMHKPGRHEGLPVADIAALRRAGGFPMVLVKADGARMRWAKAPADDEPALPPDVDVVLAVLSLRVLGRALDERAVHRPERVAAATGAVPGECVAEAHLVRLLTTPQVAFKGAGSARRIVVLNMADDAERRAAGRRIAAAVLAAGAGVERVVVADLRDPAAPVVEVLR